MQAIEAIRELVCLAPACCHPGCNVTIREPHLPAAPTPSPEVSARWGYAEALAPLEETLGPTHLHTLVTNTHLAAELLKDGESAAALSLLDEVLRHIRSILGDSE